MGENLLESWAGLRWNNEIAVRDTRASASSNLVIVPHAPLALFENSFAYRGPVIWNTLPEHIRK